MKKLLVVCFVVTLCLGLSVVSRASVWTVDPGGGGDFTTITEALNDAGVMDGDTINVAAGTYINDIWDSGLGVPDGYRIKNSMSAPFDYSK